MTTNEPMLDVSAPPARLLEMLGRSVPRYTSYPTAPHFSAEVGPELYGEWLEAVAYSGKSVSLYLHVPFCRSICHYCGCNTKASRGDAPIRAYADLLRREIAIVAARLGPVEVSHVHWGGGTPNLLPPDCFDDIVGDLAAFFRLQPDVEHAIELDPRYVTSEGAIRLARAGINRASLGVQDLNPDVQAAIGRVQPTDVVENAVAALRAAGIGALNFDLMYGLPLQTTHGIVGTAERALAMRPNRVALFGYAHVPWMKSHQRLIDEALLPDISGRFSLARATRQVICEAGFSAIGIDHFAHPDDDLSQALAARRLRRNFQGYTTDMAEILIGFGASSISRTDFGFAQNASDNASWGRTIDAGMLPVVRGKEFSGQDRLRATIIEEVLCYFDVDLARLAAKNDVSLSTFDVDLQRLAPFIEEGWVSTDAHRVRLRKHPHEIARLAAACFDSYLGRGGRHSLAM